MGSRVLIVEDSTTVRELLRVLLESEGYEIVEAKDGLEGLLKAEFARPDLLILDLMMPDVDGERVLSQLRSEPDLAHIPVIVVSGKYEALDHLGDLIGRDNVFPKPFEPTKLMDQIARLIGRPEES